MEGFDGTAGGGMGARDGQSRGCLVTQDVKDAAVTELSPQRGLEQSGEIYNTDLEQSGDKYSAVLERVVRIRARILEQSGANLIGLQRRIHGSGGWRVGAGFAGRFPYRYEVDAGRRSDVGSRVCGKASL
jgi:hypothetical protein